MKRAFLYLLASLQAQLSSHLHEGGHLAALGQPLHSFSLLSWPSLTHLTQQQSLQQQQALEACLWLWPVQQQSAKVAVAADMSKVKCAGQTGE